MKSKNKLERLSLELFSSLFEYFRERSGAQTEKFSTLIGIEEIRQGREAYLGQTL
jgi:hypothetical protein